MPTKKMILLSKDFCQEYRLLKNLVREIVTNAINSSRKMCKMCRKNVAIIIKTHLSDLTVPNFRTISFIKYWCKGNPI